MNSFFRSMPIKIGFKRPRKYFKVSVRAMNFLFKRSTIFIGLYLTNHMFIMSLYYIKHEDNIKKTEMNGLGFISKVYFK